MAAVKKGDRSRVVMNLSKEDMKQAESPANLTKLAEIEHGFPVGTCAIQRPGRLFVTESQMHKMCRKGLKIRYFWLCSDVLIYGTPITKGKYKGQAVLQLSELSVQDIEDSAEGANGIQINNKRKSFVVYAQSPREKASWIQVMNKFIALARESVGLDPQTRDAEARALWVPDSKVNQCMVSGCGLKFSLVNRKHHCRNCGKVVCGPCSASKAILNQNKPERVCKVCHEKLGGVNPTDIPVLGKASTETEQREEDSSDDSDDDDDDEVLPRGSSTSVGSEADQKMEVMRLVKEGKISMQDAVARIAASDFISDLHHVSGGTAPPNAALNRRSLSEAQVPQGPYALALYDNEDTEHEEEVKFKEGEAICLTARVSDDWLEGYVFTDSTKRVGIFPLAFVEVIVDLDED
eukprot:m.457283 g.457283  ORF g.457283 m.457283 type:complete len:407 (-) comp21225_c0_seq1:92-1312(-)